MESEAEVNNAVAQCIKAIHLIHKERLDSEISLKLTSMGLDISEDLALQHMRHILNEAEKYSVFVTIDMEDYKRCSKTIKLFKQLKVSMTT